MKKHCMLMWLLLPPLASISQVGIGTTNPNTSSVLDLSSTTSGLLPPRMTGLQRSEMVMSDDDIGMVVFQTDIAQPPLPSTPKGLYFFDGTNWNVPVLNGTANGQTLRWDGNKWAGTNNLFNQGSSIGIGTINPKTVLHLHNNTHPTTRIQISNGASNAQEGDGLLLGVNQNTNYAHLIQQENRPLWFGTNGIERMRIDSTGKVGIGTQNPSARLDVNGTFRLGSSGIILNGIIKLDTEVNIPILLEGGEGIVIIECPNSREDGTVYVSPGSAMSGLMIGYARVSSPGYIEVKFMNMSTAMDEPMPMMLHISIIQ